MFDSPISIFIKNPEGFPQFLFAVSFLHLFGHHVKKLIKVYGSIPLKRQR